MKKKRPLFRLWKEDGKWCCQYRDLDNVRIRADTPSAALRLCLADVRRFSQFQAHLKGACKPGCYMCADGDTKLKGIRAKA